MTHAPVTASGGLFGAAKRAGSLFQDPAKVIIYMAMLAGALTIAIKAEVPIPYAAAGIAIILGLACLFAEAFTAKGFIDAIWHGRPIGAVGYLFAWVCVFGYAMINWVGTASEKQVEKSNLHKAAVYATKDTRANVAVWEKKVKTIEDERSLMVPRRSAADARAAVDSAEAHKRFRDTDSCKTTRNKSQRDHCDAYRAAQADLALWDQIAVKDAELANAIAKLEDARATSASTKVEMSEDRGDLLILANMAGVDPGYVQNFMAIWQIAVMSIMISLTTILARVDELRAKGSRVRMNWGFRVKRFFARAFLGREPQGTVINYNGTLNGIDREQLRHNLKQYGVV